MNTVVSKDGTSIAYDRAGDGSVVILVDGALCSRAQGPMPELAALLAAGFTVYNYDRRGRGEEMKAVAHTLPYDAELLGDNAFGQPLDASQWAGLEPPVLVIGGGKSPAWMRTSVRAVAAAVPGAVHREIPGQNHMIKATAIAPVLSEFFGG